MTHTCCAVGCTARIPQRLVMCRKHWDSVSISVRVRFWDSHQLAQEHVGSSATNRAVVQEAIAEVARKEGRQDQDQPAPLHRLNPALAI